MNGFYVRMDKRTPEQEVQCVETYKAAELLRRRGVLCEVREWFCTSPKDDPASIVLLTP